MNTSPTVSGFLSPADMLKRHTFRSSSSRPLNVIMEEDEYRTPSPSTSLKARRRHAMANINIRPSALDDTYLSPRPAPRPCSSQCSPDSLQSFFSDLSKFPCPPSASPGASVSDLSSSPGAQSRGMPATPSTSDDEFGLPSPLFNPRRAAMQAFAIQKKPAEDTSSMHSLNDSESLEDWEWYNREMSKMICMPSQHHQPARPESTFFSSEFQVSSSRRRGSGPYASTYSQRRNSRTIVPKYPPPPPVASIPAIRLTPSPTPSPRIMNVSRPPPRSSLPADVFLDLHTDGTEGDVESSSDGSSAFSFTMYDVDYFGERELIAERPLPPTPGSAFSRSSFGQDLEFDDAAFELDDYQLQFPLSVPATPLDLHADIAMGLEKLREERGMFRFPDERTRDGAPPPPPPARSESSHDSLPQDVVDRFYTPTISSFSFSEPSPSPVPSQEGRANVASSRSRNNNNGGGEERVLKSKWSSSTLGSINEEHGRRNRSASSRLRFYFGGGIGIGIGGGGGNNGGGSGGHSRKGSQSKSSFPAKIATSPFKKHTSATTMPSSPPPAPPATPSRWPRQHHVHKRGNSSNNNHNSDVIVIGYGGGSGSNTNVGLKRRGSTTTVNSDVGSEDSASSSASGGLRRKPIPVEMFLRNTAAAA